MKEHIEALEKNFILFQTYLHVVITIYALFYYFVDGRNTNALILLGLTLILYFGRIIMVRSKYFANVRLYVVLKAIALTFYASFMGHPVLFVQGVATIMFTFIFLEVILIREPEIPSEKQNMLILGTIPILIGLVVNFNIFGPSVYVIFYYIFYVLFIVGMTFFVSFYVTTKSREKDDLKKEIKNQQFEKESLRLERSKYKQLHNALSEQKFELEQKNEVLNRISAEMYTQAELLRYISSVLDIEELIGLVTDSIIGAIGVDTCLLVIHDQESGKQYYKVNTSLGVDLLPQFKNDLSNGLFKEYFVAGKPMMDADVEVSEYPFIKDREVGSLIVVPLIKNNVTYGLLIAEHRTKMMFDDNSLNFFKSITSQIGIAVNNANIYTKMEEMAVKDGLTGLYNRREIQKMISDMIFNRKETEFISLALYDIDRFKRVNDTYGHLFGDEAIKAIAELTKKYAKQYNCVGGRYGGEEFVFVLPSKTIEEAELIMNAFHEDIQKIELIYNKTTPVKINISLGISTCPTLAKDTESLLSRADNAMYYAKKHGRGQVIVDHKDLGKTI